MAFTEISHVKEREQFPGFHARFVHCATMTIAHWRIEAGSTLGEHSHPHEQVTNVLEGQFEFTIDGETRLCGPGSVAVVPSNSIHSGRAITDCLILDVFSPVREDYR